MDSFLISYLIIGLFSVLPYFSSLPNRFLYCIFCINNGINLVHSVSISVSLVMLYQKFKRKSMDVRIDNFAFLTCW